VRLAIVYLATGLAAVAGSSCREPAGPDRIVLVVIDTLRRDAVGCYGGHARTPTIDRIALEGQKFTHAVASFHQTTMSMAALFTGRTPSIESGDLAKPLPFEGRSWCGLARFDPADEREQCVPPGVATLAERMRAAGYETIGITSNALLFDPYGLSRGFDDWIEVGDAASERKLSASQQSRAAPKVNAEVVAALKRRRSDHFFLYVHYMEVHDYRSQPGRRGRISGPRVKYRKSVEVVDAAIDELLWQLDGLGLLEGSLIVLTADHGERLGERHMVVGENSHDGNPAFEETLEVPLVVYPAPADPPDEVVRGIDLFRMLTSWAGTDPPAPPLLQPGESFTSELRWLTYRRDHWKSYTRRNPRGLYLVDLEADPEERTNVAAQNGDVARQHWDRVSALARDLRATGQVRRTLSESDAARLRSLGYVELADSRSTGADALADDVAPAAVHGRLRSTDTDAVPWRPPERSTPSGP